ncbi:MAG: pyridoxamine 5'-phosphate oxidase [Actinomycetota bacterium]|nr:pyridoxamine 5'-phosphate oxidase [Actinomycetota bacterium]
MDDRATDRDFEELSRSISQLRRDHKAEGLSEADLHPDPFVQFGRWMNDALEAGIILPNAMTLATAAADAVPSARMVLLKGVDPRGFVFYTNYESRKGQELTANPNAALVFYWNALERQVVIAGGVVKVDRDEAEDYFRSRPLGSRLGAWASPQSTVIASREELEDRAAELQRTYADGEVPIPPDWGGFRLTPVRFEFWQSRPNRLHDRFRYGRAPQDVWKLERLAP